MKLKRFDRDIGTYTHQIRPIHFYWQLNQILAIILM